MTEKLRDVAEMNDSNEPMTWFTAGPSARVICARFSVLFELHILGSQNEEEEDQGRHPPMYGRPLADATVNELYKQMEQDWASKPENVVDIERDDDAVTVAKVAPDTGPRSGAGKRPCIRLQNNIASRFESFLTTAFGLRATEITTNDRSVRRQKEPIAAPVLGGRTMFNYVVKNGKIDSRLLCVNCRDDRRFRSNPTMKTCLSWYCTGAETQKNETRCTGIVRQCQ